MRERVDYIRYKRRYINVSRISYIGRFFLYLKLPLIAIVFFFK